MPLELIEHFLIQTSDIEKTREWYKRVLGLQDGPAPDFKFPVRWLYIGDAAVIHIAEGGAGTSENRRRYLGQQSDEVRGSGAVDHIAFRCSGLKQTIDHLRSQ
jgi:catechol 2,3-dioxygenase-like lactoylglutathione lyase family enzyme